MQLGILKSLSKKMKKNLDIITIYPTASYPKVKKIIFKTHTSNIIKNIESKFIGFINIPFIKDLTQIISILRTCRKIIKQKEECKILTFNARPSVSISAIILKKIYKCEIICLLADPPVDIKERFGIKKYIMNIFWRLIEKNILYYDKIIALNEEASKIYAPKKPYIIVDGGIDIDDYVIDKNLCKKEDNNKKVVLFTGALTEYNGIKELIEAMKLIKDIDIELQICGDGPLKEYVIENSKENSNIVYKGVVSNKEARTLQVNSKLLINPRRVDDLISRVTFPSKMIEYMLSGTPVLSTKLNGLTKEYIENLYIIDNLDKYELSEKIKLIVNYNENELEKKQCNAKTFILENKIWDLQINKIYEFINEI